MPKNDRQFRESLRALRGSPLQVATPEKETKPDVAIELLMPLVITVSEQEDNAPEQEDNAPEQENDVPEQENHAP
ncbi:hypothetical protein BGZ80_007286 [Entomortierella chlamydospora]|uniref:Uncharacterized protein n=1 Tax=Entomortierella chlamydospora TaxID=101097 RepID=A0A9P6MYC3_9FUNG|nr:hypothetical protein BGZ79_008323 [Entomortierella chlamydospora]KAG0018348.1 hypothetical protein BGZ80_007286 [Entomortierella chlamydospora]